MEPTLGSAQRNLGASSASASANLSRAEQLQLTEERHAALGRHAVEQLNISINHFIGVAAVSGVAGAFLGAAAGGSWRTVVLAGAAGVTLGALGANAIARPITALENAQNELAQIKTVKDNLLKLGIDQPEHHFTGDEAVVIKQLADRYQESCADISLLAPLFALGNQTLEDFLTSFRRALMDHGMSSDDVVTVTLETLEPGLTLEQVKANPVFLRAIASCGIAAEKHDEVARLIFAYSQMILTEIYPPPTGLTPEALYRKLCLERHNYFKDRLDGEVVQLERDIEILKAMAEEKKQRSQAASRGLTPAAFKL